MQTQTDLHLEFHAPVSADRVYAAIPRVADWWMRTADGPATTLGDAFTVRFGNDGGFVAFTITDAQPGRRYVWHVDDCLLPWLTDKTEWTGTDVIFEITPTATGSTVTLVHRGLTPDVECYGACTKGWEQFFVGSLRKLVIEGIGTPQ